ncbi:hypothetical protein [Mycobacterium sp. 1423905.2]|uniref:hypothetical protein n=1 Tax=Mycobacterium sp. 1423905.2 TaxID=1856859 RepID=UPI00080172EB|nr:hypothetical protein [Mycobacterium sp. 1423905.2]OBJ56330.1 hypothetical protein A9W95_13840 [Mycobacterium sp. 1423905.2]
MSAWRRKKQPQPQAVEETGRTKMSTRALAQILERSSHIQGPAAEAYVARLRRAHPSASPAEITGKLEKRFLHAVTVSGAAVGATATLPGVGTLAALSAAAGETAVFLEATALFVLALASVYGVPLDNRERRRALVLAVLVGDNGKGAVAELIGSGRTKGGWVSESMASLPLPELSRFNQRMLKYFVKRFALKRGALMFGKLMPVGIGAIIGAIGNRMVGKTLVRNARTAFGAPPARWPVTLHLLPPIQDAS